jgi:hypothetical protein
MSFAVAPRSFLSALGRSLAGVHDATLHSANMSRLGLKKNEIVDGLFAMGAPPDEKADIPQG